MLAVAACVAAMPAAALAGKSRTASGEYNTLVVKPGEGLPPSASGRISNGVTFETRKSERYVSVVIADKSGLPTRAVLSQDVDDDGRADLELELCGATESPVAITKGIDVTVAAQEGPCADGTTAMATFGTVTATFTR